MKDVYVSTRRTNNKNSQRSLLAATANRRVSCRRHQFTPNSKKGEMNYKAHYNSYCKNVSAFTNMYTAIITLYDGIKSNVVETLK